MPRPEPKKKLGKPGRPPGRKPKGVEKPEKKKKTTIKRALLKSKKIGGRRRSTLEDNTNSDNSDSNGIFKEIDWEENFEVEENSLLDEFAPKPVLATEAETEKPTTSSVKEEKIEKPSAATPSISRVKTKLRTPALGRTKKTPVTPPSRPVRKRKFSGGVKTETPKTEPSTKQEVKKPSETKKSTSITVETDPDKFSSGMLIYVMDYGTSTWYKATVIEVDVDEEEVLVHYEDLSLSDEWVSMNSQRLSSTPPSPDPSPKKEESKPVTEAPLEQADRTSTTEPSHSKTEERVPPSPTPALPTPPIQPSPKLTPSTPVTPKILPRPKSRKRKREIPSEGSLKKPKRKKAPSESPKSKPMASSKPGRFVIGEKVLAKWSDHRMQKFPAVVKNILPDGRYDVLFYDGFEKTIAETDLSKTTDEEIEKYRYAAPSEADSLIMTDNIVSKEERRQRKKKTFSGDFFFESDFSKSKKRPPLSKLEGEFEKPIPPPAIIEIVPPVTPEPSTSSPALPAGKKTTPQAVLRKPSKAQVIRKPSIAIRKGFKGKSRSIYGRPLTNQEKYARKKARILERKEKERQEREMMLIPGAPSTSLSETKPHPILQETLQTPRKSEDTTSEGKGSTAHSSPQDSNTLSPEHTLSAETSDESGSELMPPRKIPVTQLRLDGERWIGDIPDHVYPIKITGIDGVVRKSVIVPDKHLPPGWIKHAVTIKTGGSWEAFLISPEGYKIHSNEELRGYFRDIPRREAPPELDFDLYTRALPELAIKQKDLAPRGKFKRMKHVKKKRILLADSSCPIPSSQTGRVKTLLPKPRPTPPAVHSTPPPPASVESENWKCPACDKNFRKENLLQMHINHQHAELKSLVGTAPKVADLALARSLSAYSDMSGTQEPYKVPHTPGKRLTDKHFGPDDTSSPRSPLTPLTPRDYASEDFGRRPREEKKSSIRTILPLRQPMDLGARASMDSDELDSEAEAAYYDKFAYVKRDHPSKARGARKLRPTGFSDDLSPRDPYLSMKSHKKKNPLIDKLQIATDSNDSFTEEEKPSPIMDPGEEMKLEKLKSEEIINCTCCFKEEDGLMIQCDICLCWQHGLCHGIEREDQVPEKYVCYICRNPNLVNSSRKFNYAHHYLVQGKLPTFSFRTHKLGEVETKENILKKCFDLSANVRQILNVERSIRVKLNIAEQPDHPKLYLWAKSWDDEDKKKKEEDEKNSTQIGTSQACNAPPEPEEKIDLEECRLRLLDHIEHEQLQIEQRLSTLEAQVAALEAEDPDLVQDEGDENYSVTKQTIQMLLRDLSTVRKLAHIN